METQKNVVSQRLSEVLINLNKIFLDCEDEVTLLSQNGANLGKFLDEFSEDFYKIENKVSNLIAVSAVFNAQKIAKKRCDL